MRESRKKSWGNQLAVSIEARGMAMAGHGVWSFYGGQSTISSGLHLSASPAQQQKKRKLVSFFQASGIALVSSEPDPAHSQQCAAWDICLLGVLGLLCLPKVRDIVASHWNSTVALDGRSWAVACYPVSALESRGCFWDWEGKLSSVVPWCHCNLVAVGMCLL